MITLITGVPGHGKTLYAISMVKEWAEKDGRTVYYDGIPDLMLPWIECDGENWPDLPDGALIVIDECQRIFRPRAAGKEVPRAVEQMETHRHRGIDIVLITQHAMLIDANIRRLVGRHFHVSRRWGLQRALVLEFEACKEQPVSAQAMATQRHEWRYPRDVYKLYKSASQHTVKARVPPKLFLMVFLVGFILWGGWFLYARASERMSGATPGAEASKGGASGVVGGGAAGAVAKPLTVAEYVTASVPRIRDLPHTAPKYDEMTKPTSVPVPAACYSRGRQCKCFTQQATYLETSLEFCRQVVRYGYFEEFARVQESKMPVAEGVVPVRPEQSAAAGDGGDGEVPDAAGSLARRVFRPGDSSGVGDGGASVAAYVPPRWDGRQTPRRDY